MRGPIHTTNRRGTVCSTRRFNSSEFQAQVSVNTKTSPIARFTLAPPEFGRFEQYCAAATRPPRDALLSH